MKPRLGIVIPTGRYIPELEKTLTSLLSQEIEVAIAIFDASGDDRTKDLIDRFREHFTYVHHGTDGGQAAAISLGWETLNTEVVGWLNDDDYLAPGTLSKVIKVLDDNPTCTGVFGPSVILNRHGDFAGMHPAVDPSLIEDIFTNNIISQPSCFIKHDQVKQVGGINTGLHYTMDWDLWARLLNQFPESFVYDEDVVSAVIFSRDTKTAKISFRRLFEIFAVTRRYNSLIRSMLTVFAFLKWGIIQLIESEKKTAFFKPQTNQYIYWASEKPFTHLCITGNLSPENIRTLEQMNDISLISSDQTSYKFSFKREIEKGELVKIRLDDIDHLTVKYLT